MSYAKQLEQVENENAAPPTDKDGYKADLLAIATLMRAHRPVLSRVQWRTWLRFLEARGDDRILPPDLVQS